MRTNSHTGFLSVYAYSRRHSNDKVLGGFSVKKYSEEVLRGERVETKRGPWSARLLQWSMSGAFDLCLAGPRTAIGKTHVRNPWILLCYRLDFKTVCTLYAGHDLRTVRCKKAEPFLEISSSSYVTYRRIHSQQPCSLKDFSRRFSSHQYSPSRLHTLQVSSISLLQSSIENPKRLSD